MNTEKEPEPCPGCTDADCACDGLSEGRLLLLRLEAAQAGRGLQWRDVALALGVSPPAVAGWRKSGRVPDGRVEAVESWLASPGYSGPSAVEAMDAGAEVIRLEARVAELEADLDRAREDLADVRVVIQCALSGMPVPELSDRSQVAREAAAALVELRGRMRQVEEHAEGVEYRHGKEDMAAEVADALGPALPDYDPADYTPAQVVERVRQVVVACGEHAKRAVWTGELPPSLPPHYRPDPPPGRLTAEELRARGGLLEIAEVLRKWVGVVKERPPGPDNLILPQIQGGVLARVLEAIVRVADGLESRALDLDERVGGAP